MTIDALLATGPSPVGSPRPSILPTREDSGLLTVSGQTATRTDGTLLHSGVVGTDVDLAKARDCAWLCAANVLRAVGDLDRVAQVNRITVYVASAPTFVEQHLVADAATEFFVAALGEERGRHSRAAIGVASLPTGSPVEVDAIIRLR